MLAQLQFEWMSFNTALRVNSCIASLSFFRLFCLFLLKLHALKLFNASAQFHHMLEQFTQWEAACKASLTPFLTRLIMIFLPGGTF